MRYRSLLLAALLLLVPIGAALATGIGGDTPPARIPIPARPFSATVEDQSGVKVDVTSVTFNGEVFLYGYLGDGQVTIPFESIREVRIESSDQEEKRVAAVTTRDGQTLRITVDDDTLTYGHTEFGNYSIEVQKLKIIRFPDTQPTPAAP